MTEDDFNETISNLHQRIGALETLNENMTLAREEDGMNRLALQAARQIEDLFAQGGSGRDTRLRAVQIMVRESIRIALKGETNWNASVIRMPRSQA